MTDLELTSRFTKLEAILLVNNQLLSYLIADTKDEQTIREVKAITATGTRQWHELDEIIKGVQENEQS